MTERKYEYNLRPLPGGRRGASGADAGCHSMRSIGDEGLNRRAPIEQYASADQSSRSTSPESLFPSLPSSPATYLNNPTELCPLSPSSTSVSTSSSFVDVVQQASVADQPAPTTTGQRARKKWSRDMNIFILRTYFIITNLETDTKTYLTELHEKFIVQFPEMEVSKQRVGCQRRAIISNKLLSTEDINGIRAEVENKLRAEPRITNTSYPSNLQQRMRWSNQINESIIRQYLLLTELETNITGYRPKLHEHITLKHPEIAHFSEQRIADQRRAIINNKMLTDERIQQIREEVANILYAESNNTPCTPTTSNYACSTVNLNTDLTNPAYTQETILTTAYPNNSSPTQCIAFNENRDQNTQPQPNDNSEHDDIEDTFRNALNKFCDTDPAQRPYIPKQSTSRKLARIVSFINSTLLPKYLLEDDNFEALHSKIYCAAYTAAIYNGSKIRDTVNIQTDKDHTPMAATSAAENR